MMIFTWSSSADAGSAGSPPMQLPQPTSTSSRLPTNSAARDLHSKPGVAKELRENTLKDYSPC